MQMYVASAVASDGEDDVRTLLEVSSQRVTSGTIAEPRFQRLRVVGKVGALLSLVLVVAIVSSPHNNQVDTGNVIALYLDPNGVADTIPAPGPLQCYVSTGDGVTVAPMTCPIGADLCVSYEYMCDPMDVSCVFNFPRSHMCLNSESVQGKNNCQALKHYLASYYHHINDTSFSADDVTCCGTSLCNKPAKDSKHAVVADAGSPPFQCYVSSGYGHTAEPLDCPAGSHCVTYNHKCYAGDTACTPEEVHAGTLHDIRRCYNPNEKVHKKYLGMTKYAHLKVLSAQPENCYSCGPPSQASLCNYPALMR